MNCIKLLTSLNLLLVVSFSDAAAASLFSSRGELRNGTRALCKALKIEDRVTNAEQFNAVFQREFLRPKGKERWEAYELGTKIGEEDFDAIASACKKLGMLRDVRPRLSFYDYIVIFGSSTEFMRRACEFVSKEMGPFIVKNRGIKIFFLTAARPLDERIDSPEIMKELGARKLPVTEEQAARMIFEKEMAKFHVECEFIGVDPKTLKREAGELKRANTGDTVDKFLRECFLPPGAMVAVSTNPFIGFQDCVMRNKLAAIGWFGNGGRFETVGYHIAVDDYAKRVGGRRQVINILLDSVARRAYEEIKRVRPSVKRRNRTALVNGGAAAAIVKADGGVGGSGNGSQGATPRGAVGKSSAK
jgi:hypothetical protein